MTRIKDQKYADQMSCLIDEHGFSRAQANALVLWTRGSTSSQRVDSPDAVFAALPEPQQSTAREIFLVIMAKHRDLELVIANGAITGDVGDITMRLGELELRRITWDARPDVKAVDAEQSFVGRTREFVSGRVEHRQ